MAAPNSFITPQTGALANQQFNATEADKVIFAVSGTALGAAEVVTFSIANTTAGKTPIYNAAGTQVSLTPALQSVMLEGGFVYVLDKSITAAASGVDVNIKPRIGP